MFKLRYSVQNYEWGKLGSSSLVGNMLIKNDFNSDKIDENKPYAESWYGTHPSGPSYATVDDKEELLSQIIEKNQSLVGEKCYNKW